MNRSTIYRWLKAGLPIRPDGFFDLDEIDKWRQARDGIIPAGSTRPADGDTGIASSQEKAKGKAYWESENKRLQAEERFLKLKLRRGELVERQEVEREFVARILAFRSGLLGLERSLPPDLVYCSNEREMAAVLQRAFRGLLENYSRRLPEHLSPIEKG